MLLGSRHNTPGGHLALTTNGHLPVVQAVELADKGPVDGGGGGKGDSGGQLAACRGRNQGLRVSVRHTQWKQQQMFVA